MKKIFLIASVFLICGFTFFPKYTYENLNFGVLERSWDYIGFFSKNHIEFNAKKDVIINAERDLVLQTDNYNEDSQIVVYVPTNPNGTEKIQGTLWFSTITKTLKFEPTNTSNRVTCGGIE